MRIYPFTRHSGKLARLLMNYIILQSGYLPAIIHAVERQRYYEALRASGPALVELVSESLENAIDSALRLVGGDELARSAAQ